MTKEDKHKVESGKSDSTFLYEDEEVELDEEFDADEEVELGDDFDFLQEEDGEADDDFNFDFLKKDDDGELDSIENAFPKLEKQPDIDLSFQELVAKKEDTLTVEPKVEEVSKDTQQSNDHYQYLLDEIEGKGRTASILPEDEMTESALKTLEEEQLTIREMLTSNRVGVITADEENPEDFQFQYKKEEEEYDFDLNRILPNVPLAEITEYLRIEGIYSEAFKEFLTSQEILKDGSLPLAVVLEGEDVIIRSINPEPKALFKLRHVLKGFKFTHVRDEEELEFNIFSFLETAKLTL